MGNGSHASVHGTGTVDLKFTLGKIMQLKNVHHVPSIHKNLVSGTLLYRDGFKVVLESNKLVVSKSGPFIGKGYDCGGLFRFSLLDFNNKSVNHIALMLMILRVFGILVCVILILLYVSAFNHEFNSEYYHSQRF
jgi:hypothetical protein